MREAVNVAGAPRRLVPLRFRSHGFRVAVRHVLTGSGPVGPIQRDLPLHGSTDVTVGGKNPCDGSLVHLVPGQQ